MKKSIIKNISLGIACLLGVGGAITAGVLSTNSPSINNAEATTYGLHVGNIEVTSDNLTIDSSDTAEITSGSATYNPETKTLTLDNFNYQGAGYSDGNQGGAIDSRGDDLTILLKGNSSILKQNDNSINNSYGIYFKGDNKSLTIDKDGEGGRLEINFWASRNGYKSNGIFLEPGSFVMNGGTVVSNAGIGKESAGIYADDGITFNGGSFTGRGSTTTAYESRGIYCSNITINGGEVFGYAPLENSYAAYGYDNSDIYFNSGDLYAEGKTAFKSTYYVQYPSGTTILGGDSQDSATVQPDVSGGLHYYHLSFVHEHNWSYTADGDSITAECQAPNCFLTTGLTLTIGAPSNLVYSGTAKTAVLNSFSAVAFGTPEISYYKDNVLVSECVDVGTYEARVTVGGKTATKSFAITKAEYISRSWDETNKEVVSTTSTCETYTIVASDTTSWTNGVWYVVNSDVTISSRISVTGTVNLILCDGKTLTASQGIEVLTGNTLNIYGQSEDTGKIIATGIDGNACIGGNDGSDCGSINIQGGCIEANIHSGNVSTGIGGGNEKGFKSIVIYGGMVEATGSRFAPAIGSQHGSESDPGTITIYGGSVIATGGENAAAIGGGPNGFGELVTISGGSVTATGGANGSGIGIGSSGTGGTVSITGGRVTAKGGSGGAGIGGKTISISGGELNATGVAGDNDNGAAGIGSGDGSSGPSVTISGGKVTATGGNYYSAGIGRAVTGGNHGTLTVENDLPVFGGGSSESLTIKTAEQYAVDRWQYMKVGNFHTHNFISYSASGNVITATCDNADGNCPLTNYQATLTISAPSGSLIYDGTEKPATYVDTSSGVAFSGIKITYIKQGDTSFSGIPTDAGAYTALISFNERSLRASIQYDILKANVTYTAPTGKENLSYSGSEQDLVVAGSATGGTMQYKLGDNGVWSEEVPAATNAGTYNVYYKVVGDANHNDFIEETPIEVIIDKADVTLTPPEGTIIRYDGDDHELVTSGSVTGGALFYKLGDGDYSTSIPTASNIGTYDIYYKVVGDSNHNDIAETGPIHSSITDAVAYLTDGSTVTTYGSINDAVSAWNSANAGSTLTLLKDVTVSSAITVSSSKTLDLNGYGIRQTGNYRIFKVTSTGNLTIIDSDPTHAHAITLEKWRGTSVADGTGTTTVNDGGTGIAYITGGYLTGGNVISSADGIEGACLLVNGNGGRIDLEGGTIIGNYLNVQNCAGSGVGVINGGTFLMHGGTITYNYSQNSAAGIENIGSKVEIYNGTISHNKNSNGGGAAISVTGTGSLKLYGGRIEGNTVSGAYGVVDLYRYSPQPDQYFGIMGSPVVQDNSTPGSGYAVNVRLYEKINIDGELTQGAKIGVSLYGNGNGSGWTNGSGVFTTGWSTYMQGKDPADYFVSDNPNYSVYLRDGEAYCGEVPAAKVQNGETITYYVNFSDALTAWTENTTLTLFKDIVTSSTITVDNTRTLDLNGYGFRASNTGFSIFNVTSSGNLTINDSNPSHAHKVTLSNYIATEVSDGTGEDSVNDGNGTAYINGGYVAGGYNGMHGGAFYVSGGTLTLNGGTVIGNRCDEEFCAGGGIYLESNGYFKMNGGSIKYNYSGNSGAGIAAEQSTIEINGGVISFNRNNWAGGGAMSIDISSSLKLYGGVIENNVSRHAEGAINFKSANQYFEIKGSPIVRNNTSIEGGYAVNLFLNSGVVAKLEAPLSDEADVHLFIYNAPGVITDGWSTHMAGKDPTDYFFSDNPDYSICLKDGEAYLRAGHTVTFNTNGRGIAPDPVVVSDGSLVNKPTDPTVEGYEVKGWYKEAECENIWDFDNDTVTEDITLYALWDYDEDTGNVIKLINDIGTLTYDGGSNDSLADILAAKTAYDDLTPGRKVIVDGVNKDILDHDVTTYKNVDKVGDLINAIPEPSPDKTYYDAIDLAKTEYDKLTEEEVTILNSVINYQEFLNDNIAARKVIIEIEEIGEVTYDGGINDSKKDIEKAEKSYDELTKDQKDIVDYVNHDVLVDDREIYDQMAKAIKAIKEIGKVENNEETKEKIEEARKIYDSLPEELKEFVKQYEDSLKVLEDDEKVLDVLVLIDDIGDVNYDSASQEKIEEARRLYDSLTEEQKRLIAPEALEKLEEKEATYTSLNNTGNSLLVVFLIISGLLLILGLIVMYFIIRKKKEDNGDDNNDNSSNKSKTMKLASFTGSMPFIIYASHYLDSGYILLYIIIALTVIVWLTNLVLFILKKKGLLNKKKEEVKPVETIKESEPVKPAVIVKDPEPVNEEEEEVVTITDEKGNIFNIRYIKSFTAKLIQSPEETKKYYEELKNYVLSYKKTTSRISWHYDSVNSGRNQVLKFAIRGKTLCVYYPLNAGDYNDTKYKVEAVESKKFEEVPCLYRIKNDRRLGYAKDLIDTVMFNLGLVKGEEQHEVYSDLPYEENRPLILRGLIKEQKIQVNKPVEQVVSKKVNDEGDEIVTTKDSSGNLFEIRYIKSFTAKLSQASEEVKDYYNELKNYALSYKKANSRISWHYDSINVGRNQVIKFSVRGKTLCVYYALNANDYLDTKYKVEQVESKKFEEVPCLYRIKNDRRRDYAKDLIDTVMANVPTEKGKESSEDFRIPYESTKALLAKGLIKENKVQVNKIVEEVKPVEVVNEDEEEETVTYTDEKGNIFNIRYIKSFTAKLIQSPDETKKYYEELKNYVLSYKKTTSRISWHYDSINSGRNQVLKFAIRGKTLCVYYPLNAEDYNDSKYKVEAVESKKFEEVPCLYRIKNDRRLGYAKDLIDTVMSNLGLVKGEEQHEVYSNLPYEENRPLILRGLIKELKIQVNKPVEEPVVTKVEEVVIVKAEEVDNKMSDEEATSKISENVESKRHHGKKGIINIDVIARDFNNNDVVNIEALWKKKIISTNIGHVKVLARGSLDKKLHIELQDYSLQAVKMILLAGGTVKKVN